MIHTDEINAVQHTLKIAILDPATVPGGWDIDKFCDIQRALPTDLPFTRWKYLKVPFELHHPVWVEDPNFDIEYHIRHVACPAPGDNRALCSLIAQLYISPLDHNRPLWIVWVIEGLAGGKVASVMLLHHAYTDGSGATLMMQRYFKPQPFSFDLHQPPWNPPPVPTKLRLLTDALCELPGTLISTIPRVVRGVVKTRQLLARQIAEGKDPAPNLLKDLRDSPFNDMLSACRSFAFETFELERVKRLSKFYQVTINDLFVACAAATNRRFMIDKGYDPDTGPLLTAIPFTQRSQSETDDGIGNKITTDYLAMPVHIADPLDRLAAAHRAGNIMKEHYREVQGADLSSVLDMLPAYAIRAINRSIARARGKKGLGGNAMLSNVAGPRQVLYMGEMRLDNWISTGQVLHGLAVNMTAWSYADNFNVCILADKKVLPDPWVMIGYFRAALDEYEHLAPQKDNAAKTNGIES